MKRHAILLVAGCIAAAWAGAWAQAPGQERRVRLIDSQRQPVSGATVGTGAYGQSGAEPRWRFYAPSAESNDEGIATLQLRGQGDREQLLYALDQQRLLAGHAELSGDMPSATLTTRAGTEGNADSANLRLGGASSTRFLAIYDSIKLTLNGTSYPNRRQTTFDTSCSIFATRTLNVMPHRGNESNDDMLLRLHDLVYSPVANHRW